MFSFLGIPHPPAGAPPSEPAFQVDACFSVNELLTSVQRLVMDGAVIVLVDACRTETGLAVTNVAGQTDCRYDERQSDFAVFEACFAHGDVVCHMSLFLFAVPRFTARTASWPLLPWLAPRHTISLLTIVTAASHQDCWVALAATATWRVSNCLPIECGMLLLQPPAGLPGPHHRSLGCPPPWAPHPDTWCSWGRTFPCTPPSHRV